MKRYMQLVFIVFLVTIGVVACQDTEEESDYFEATVTNVVDGDTFDAQIEVYGVERVRPILVDAPEICHDHSPPDCEPEPYGEEATVFAQEVLLGETVYLERDESEYDQYDRLLFYVYLEDGRMFQEMLLEKGLAEVVVFDDTKYLDQFEEIEEEARKDERGVWSIDD